MKKICFYSSSTGYGGAEIYLENLIIGCIRHGYDCTLVLNKCNTRFIESLSRNNISCEPVRIKGEYDLSHFYEFSKIIRKIKPDIFHVNLPGPWNAQLISLIAKICAVKFIVSTEHLPMFGPSIRHSVFKFLDSLVINKCIAVSQDNVQYLRKLHMISNGKIRVVHNGIDIEKYHMRKISYNTGDGNLKNFNVGIVGRLTEQKGHAYAIDAFSVLCKKYDDLVLSIYGDGELLDECKSQVNKLALNEKVIFHGFVSDMPNVYQNIDVLLMPSTFEALPLTLLESMASGVPAIASNINGIPEIIDNNKDGILIQPKVPQEIINSLDKILSDKNQVIEMAKAARDKIEDHYSLEIMVKNTINVYSI